MEIVTLANAPFYIAPNHEGVTSRRLQGGDASSADFAWVAHSQFPPGVVVPIDVGAIGKIYVVIEGSLTIAQADGIRHRLHQWDSIFIAAGEARSIVNDSGEAAAIIVVTPPPAKNRMSEGGGPNEIRNALGAFATGVTVVTTIDNTGAPVGVTASSFNSVRPIAWRD